MLCDALNTSRNTNSVFTNESQAMSIINFLERLAEMFPSQDYQSRLNRFILSQNPQSHKEVENLEKQFNYIQSRNLSL